MTLRRFLWKEANDMMPLKEVFEKVVEQINKNFKTSRLPKDFVKAWISGSGESFCLRIGARDIQIDFDGSFVGSGSTIDLIHRYQVIDHDKKKE